jgi:DNA-binding MarR family transcriptional regulator
MSRSSSGARTSRLARVDVGRLLGISKQAAGKTIDRLEQLGYAERAADATDGRRKLVRLTPSASTR